MKALEDILIQNTPNANPLKTVEGGGMGPSAGWWKSSVRLCYRAFSTFDPPGCEKVGDPSRSGVY